MWKVNVLLFVYLSSLQDLHALCDFNSGLHSGGCFSGCAEPVWVLPAVLRCTPSSQWSPSSVCSRSAPSAGGKAPNVCFAFKTHTLCCLSGHNTEEVTQLTFLCRWSELPHIWTDFHDQLKNTPQNLLVWAVPAAVIIQRHTVLHTRVFAVSRSS